MKHVISAFAVLGFLSLAASCGPRCPETADILIVGGTVYDGSENKAVKADVAISGDRIVYVAPARKDILSRCSAARTLHAEGCVVCPGFIDPHDHLEKLLLSEHTNEPYLRMGVTTVICGMCGGSRYPIQDFFSKLEEHGIGTNVASFTGHNTIRRALMGDEARHATDGEIARMKEMIRREMANGSFGLSTGLYYVPGCFSETREVVEIASAMADLGGIYTTHVRNENKEGIGLVKSIREALEIGRAAGVQVNISHIKCLGRTVWHRADSVINLIESYRHAGMTVTADQYPYLASGLSMSAALTPAWARDGGLEALRRNIQDPAARARMTEEIPDLIHERGGAETIYIADLAGDYSRMTLSEAAEKMGKGPVDAVLELMKRGDPYINTFIVCEEDFEAFMKTPWVLTCTDGTFGKHPRGAGTYAELIQKYVVQKPVISLGRFIRRSTGQVAETYRLSGRGFIRPGYFADITVFRPEEVRAHATYSAPTALSTGFKYVLVNGRIAVEEDVCTGSLSGVVIRRGSE